MEDYNLEVSLEDYKSTIQKKGYGIVYNSEEFPIKKLDKIVLKKFAKYIFYANSIIVNIKLNSEVLLFDIHWIGDKLHEYAPNCEVLIGYEFSDDILIGNCEVELLITGLDNAVILMANLLS